MSRAFHLFLAGYLILGVAAPASADRCTTKLRRLEGWTIISVTHVDGEFEGCDANKIIRFLNGSAYQCTTGGYSSSYKPDSRMPDAIVFGKQRTSGSKSIVMIKVLIEGELYDMMAPMTGE